MAAVILPDYIDNFVSRSEDGTIGLVSPSKPIRVGREDVKFLYVDLAHPGLDDDGHYVIISEDGYIAVIELRTLRVYEGDSASRPHLSS